MLHKARRARRTIGGAQRIRIGFATAAIAVVVIPLVLFSLLGGSAAGSARVRQGAAPIQMKVMSYAQAVKAAKLVTFYNAVTTHEVETYLQEGAFLEAVANANTMPAAWEATAACEEGGRNDPYAGYFGILEWNGFDGYPTAGSAPLSVQLAWESAHGISPPDAPGECHGY